MIEQCVFIFEGNLQGSPAKLVFGSQRYCPKRLKSGQDKARSDDAGLITNYPAQKYISDR